MKKVLMPILCTLSLLAGCTLVVPTEKYNSLQDEANTLHAQIEQLETQIGELQAQNTALEEKITERREQEITDPFDEKILGSLFLRPDLIPVGGEEMRYYTDVCRVLTERYVYAYAEDGRNAADMILSYERQDDATFAWSLEAYDAGKGWQTGMENGATDTTGTVPAPLETTSAPPEPDSDANSNASSQAPQESVSSQEPQSSAPKVGVPVPNEAQQQKFRDIASLIEAQ